MDNTLLTFLACICFIFLIGRLFIVPIKKVLKIIINSILGGVLIYLINISFTSFGFHIGLNFITTLCIGLLGIPGAILLIILKLFVG